MKNPQKTSKHFFSKPIVLASVSVILAALLYSLWAVNVNHPKQHATSAEDCTPTAILVNPCRPWLGSYSGGYTGAASDANSQLTFLNKRLNNPSVLTNTSLAVTLTKKIDIAHVYHGQGNNLFSASDMTLINSPDYKYVFVNWKPLPAGYTWADAAGGNATVDNYIRAGVDAIRALGSNKKIFLTIFHEPENDVSSSICTSNAAGAGEGSPKNYVDMWHNVRSIFNAEYQKTNTQSNVVWAINFMGFVKWNCLIPSLWPGNSYVDWIMYDPYGSGTSGFDSSVSVLYDFLSDPKNNDATHSYTSKAWGLNEFGYGSGASSNFNEAGAQQYWKDAVAAMTADKYPNLKMYNVFDTNANSAHSQVGTSIDGGVSVTKQTSFNSFASALFAKQGAVTPPPADTTPPAVSVTTPGSGSTVSNTITIAANASDAVGVSDVKFYVDSTLIKDDALASDGWTIDWATSSVANGAHTLKAVAYDAAGNSATATTAIVVNNIPAPTITSFKANPTSVASGGMSSLSWATTNATSCAITPGGPTGTNATASTAWQTSAITSTTTYTLTCVNASSTSVTSTVTVTVAAPPQITSFTASPQTVTVGSTATLTWAVANTTTCDMGPSGSVGMTTTSWQTPEMTTVGTTTYNLTCRNAAGATTQSSVKLAVQPAPTPPTNVLLTSDKQSVAKGGSVTLSWTSTGSEYCVLYPGAYKALGTTSSKTLTNLQSTTTYYLNCYNGVGKTVSSGTKVTVGAATVAAPVIAHLGAYPNPISPKQQSTLYWSTSNVPQGGCAVAPSPLSSTWPNGQWTTPILTSSATYTLTCKNSAGAKVSQSITITVSRTVGFGPRTLTDIGLAAAHLSSTVASTTSSSAKPSNTVTATTGQQVVDGTAVSSVVQNSLVTLDLGTITESTEISQISRLEYYNGPKLIETVNHTPFALNTHVLAIGTYNITQRTYFKDGSMAQTSQLITVARANGSKQSTWLLAGITVGILVVVAILMYPVRLLVSRRNTPTQGMPTPPVFDGQTPVVTPPTGQPHDDGPQVPPQS